MTLSAFVTESLLLPLGERKEFSLDLLSLEGISNSENSSFVWESSVRFLESKGFSVGVTTSRFPEGVYIAEGLSDNKKLKGWGLESETPETIIVKNIGWPLLSKCPVEPITQMGLKVVPHHTMSVIFGNSKNENKVASWDGIIQTIPYSIFGLSIADTSGIQYGQSAFEGACAMKNQEGEVFGFRIDKNSQRFVKSTLALNLPEISAKLVQKSIEETIKNNADYIPSNGKGQLYIRPSVCGLSGGLGIIVPDFFIFTVEIAAMGSYFAPTISVEGRKDIHRPYTGANKIAPNYGASYKIKEGVKARGYTDYLSFTEDGFTEEVATCAVGFIDKNGAFVFPPVQDEVDSKERHILPSITRYSTIEVLQTTGETVIIRDVHADEIAEMNGMFTMGNAVGILHVDKLCLKNSEQDEGQIIRFSDSSQEIIAAIKDKIFAARVQELKGFEDWAVQII